MEIIQVTSENLKEEHICCAIGNDKKNKERANVKKEWMSQQFSEGLVFKKVNVRGKVFIEYAPIEAVWKPIEGENYMVINCLWVSGQYKGKGFSVQLLNECIKEAKEKGKDGVVVVSSSKVQPFLTDKKFFIKQGFTTVDTAPPYFELLLLKINEQAKNPVFAKQAKQGVIEGEEKDFTFVYSPQCPFTEEYVYLLHQVAIEQNRTSRIIKLTNSAEAKEKSNPFGTYGLYYKNKFLTHELMSEKKFLSIMQKLA